MNNKWLLALVISALTGTAFAAAPSFKKLDIDQDGSLSQQEFASVKVLEFDRSDTNKDGTVDQREYDLAVMRDIESRVYY